MILFIPIKEKSQRVPKKNFRQFAGRELWRHAINKYRDLEIHVNTDSEELLKRLKMFSHVIPYKRKRNLCGHKVSVNKLITDFLSNEAIKDDEIIAQVHVTSPFLKTSTIIDAEYYFKLGYDSVVSCDVFKNRFWRKEKYGYCPVNHNPMTLLETQQLPEYYMENSAFYMFTKKGFLENQNRIGKNPAFHPIDFPEDLDIDTEDDWKLCKKLEDLV